jgi:hypothetical protein
MAAKSVDAFFEKVAGSKALQAKLKALHQKALKETKRIKDQASAEVVKIAAAVGFRFKLADLTQARKGKASRAQLAEVVGQAMDCSGGTYSYCTAQNWTCMRGSWY